MDSEVVIQPEQLANLLSTHSVYILDGTYNPASDMRPAHFSKRIPSAKYFNLHEIRDTNSPHPLAVPTLPQFRDAMIRLGLKNDGTLVVVYDMNGITTCPRVWWTLKYFGYPNVKILNGGLPRWVEQGNPTESGEYTLPEPASVNDDDYKFVENHEIRAYIAEVEHTVNELAAGHNQKLLLDPRPPEDVQAGAVPRSSCVPARDMYNPDKTLKTPEQIRSIFQAANFNLSVPVITTCMRGINASHGYFLLNYIGKQDAKVYAGSFAEWKMLKGSA